MQTTLNVADDLPADAEERVRPVSRNAPDRSEAVFRVISSDGHVVTNEIVNAIREIECVR